MSSSDPLKIDSSQQTKAAEESRDDVSGPVNRAGWLNRHRVIRELFVIIAFCFFTAALTWPYVTRLRDAVVDPGDPYLVSWIMWWDYHQTFHDPLNLFHANVFFPLRYTLAFSEHCYGVALPFFPLFALGLRPLTVQCVAMFFGFALSGYGAFRLARTLTGSMSAAWVAGIAFAFVPMRFTLMSQLVYLFSLWLPLLFEAFVLLVRRATWKTATWFGVALFMTGLTSVSFLAFALVPLALIAVVLITRYERWHDRVFWRHTAISAGIASLALVPFTLPYYLASRLYGFKRSIEEVKANSAWPIHWLSVENRNKLWFGMGESMPEGARFKLFPGLLTLLLSFAAIIGRKREAQTERPHKPVTRQRWIKRLDIAAVVLLGLSVVAVGFDETHYFKNFFLYVTSARVLGLLMSVLLVRCSISYPSFLRARNRNLIETIKSDGCGDALWVGGILSVVGFCYSLGWNFFFYRLCYDLLFIFGSIRVPTRGAMFAYLGLSLLAAAGARFLIERLRLNKRSWAYAVLCLLLLAELNAAPLGFMRGAVYPDAVTLRLTKTPMRGGIVVLPAGPDFNHSYMLRAADHQKPLIVGTSGFVSYQETRIEQLTQTGPIDSELMTLMESIPTSYVVIKNDSIDKRRKLDYEVFLRRAVTDGRLRYINRFDGRDDLYAVTKNEPDAKSESVFPFAPPTRDWASLIEEDQTNLLGYQTSWSQLLYRIHLTAFGTMPRYSQFLADAKRLGRDLVPGSNSDEKLLGDRLQQYALEIVQSDSFKKDSERLDNRALLQHLYENAGIHIDASETNELGTAQPLDAQGKAALLIKVASDSRVAQTNDYPALVLLHYFSYFERNPDDPPDSNLNGFNFWLRSDESKAKPDLLTAAFRDSIEYRRKLEKRH